MQATYELVAQDSGHSFRLLRETKTEYAFHWHLHPEAELTLVFHGHGRCFVGDHAAAYTAPDLVLIPGGLPHTWQSDPLPAGEENDAVVIQFDWEALLPDGDARPELRSLRDLRRAAARGLRFPEPLAADLLQPMLSLWNLPPLRRYLKVLELLDQLATANATPLASPAYHSSEHADQERVISEVCRLIIEHPEESWTLDRLGTRVGMSASSLSRYFKRVTGTTVSDFILETRIGHVCRRLIETDRAISTLAHEAGFHNLSHFNRQFLRRRGVSPRAYRRGYAG